MPKENHPLELQPSKNENVPDAQITKIDSSRQPTIVIGGAGSRVGSISPSEQTPTISPSACQSGGDDNRRQDPKASQHQPDPLPRLSYLGESRKQEERRAEILRRAREMDPPLTLRELEHMSAFKAALQIHQPMDDHAWKILRPRLISQLPGALNIIHQNEQLIKSIMAEQEEQARPHSSSLTATEARDAALASWNETQRPIRESLEQIARAFIDKSWNGGDGVTHQNVANFAARVLIHTRREFLNSMPQENKLRLPLDAMRWIYETVIKPITDQHAKNVFACNFCDAPLKSFEGCIQHYAAKHTNSLSRGSAVVAWREADWPEVSPFNPVPASRGQAVQTPQPYSQVSTSPFPIPPHSATPQSSSASWRAPFHPSPAHSLYYPLSTPIQEYSPYLTSAATSPISSNFWGAPPTNQSPGYSPRSHGYIYPPPLLHPVRTPLTDSTIMVHPTSASLYPPIPSFPPSPFQPISVTTSQGPERLGQMMNETWILLWPLENIDTSVLVYASVHNAILEFHSRNSATPTLEMVLATVDNDPQLANLRDAGTIDCKTCTKRMLSYARESSGEASTISVKLYKFNALLKHFKKAHEGRNSPKIHETIPGYSSPVFDWKKDMISLPDGPRISQLAHDPKIDSQRLAVLRRVFPHLIHSPSTHLSHAEEFSDEYDPRNPEITWHTIPGRSKSNRNSVPTYNSQLIGMKHPITANEQFDDQETGRHSSHGPNHTKDQSIQASHQRLESSPLPKTELMNYENKKPPSIADRTLHELETEYLLRQATRLSREQFEAFSPSHSADRGKIEREISNGIGRDSSRHQRYYEYFLTESSPYFGVQHHTGGGETNLSPNQPRNFRREQVDDSYPRSWAGRDYIPLSGDFKGSHKRKRSAETLEYETSKTSHSNLRDNYGFDNKSR